MLYFTYQAEVAQLVERRTENPCVGSSILPLGIFSCKFLHYRPLVKNKIIYKLINRYNKLRHRKFEKWFFQNF